MAVLNVQDEFQSGDNVTATNLNNLVKDASFNADTTDNSTLEVHTSGYLKVKDAGVQTQHIGDDQVTYAKMQDVAALSVIGNNTNATATPTAIAIDDLKDNISNATTSDDGLMSSTDKDKLDNIAANATANAGTVTSVSGSGGLTGTVTSSGSLSIADNGVTAARISDTDTQFLVDDTSTQKKVVINEGGADVDFRVEGDGNTNLIVTQASNDTIGLGGAVDSGYRVAVDSGNLFPMFLKSTASAGGTGIVAHNTATNSTGGVLQLGAPNQTSITTTANLDVSCPNNWILLGHNGSDQCSVRLENSNTGTASGAFFPGANGTQDLGKSSNRWGTIYASAVNLSGNTVVSKASSGLLSTHGTTTVANGNKLTFQHNLNTKEVQVSVYVGNSSGSNLLQLSQADRFNPSSPLYVLGVFVEVKNSVQVEVTLGSQGFLAPSYTNNPNGTITNFGATNYTHVNIVVTG